MANSERFHKAAKDGMLSYLKDATRKDANAKDEDWMTPVLWAAFEGHLDALRLLCAKGGDPDKCDQFGNTALHLSSAKGHLHCVEFLVKFGVNIYALDIDKHSAKDLAAINNREEILRYLDAAAARMEVNEKKKSKSLKELAEKNCEKHIREYLKRQQKLEPEYTDIKPQKSNATSSHHHHHHHKSSNMLYTLKQKIWSSQGNLSSKAAKEATTKFSELVGGGGSATNAVQQKLKSQGDCNFKQMDNCFKIAEHENDGRRTVSSLTGLQRDSEVLYVGTFNSNDCGGGAGAAVVDDSDDSKRGKISDVFELEETCSSDNERETHTLTLSRSYSQPDILSDSGGDAVNTFLQRPPGIFERPMLGSIAFRRTITAALSQLQPECVNEEETASKAGSTTRSNSTGGSKTTRNNSIGGSSNPRNYLISDSESESEADSESVGGSPIQRFLTVWGLEEYLPVFEQQHIDLDTLMILTEADLKSLKSLPLGPFRKLTFAIQERKNALANPGIMQDTCL